MESEIKYGLKDSEFNAAMVQFLQHRRDGMEAQLNVGVTGDDIRRTWCECDDCTAVVVDWIHVHAHEAVKTITERPLGKLLKLAMTSAYGKGRSPLADFLDTLVKGYDSTPTHEHDSEGGCIVEGHPDWKPAKDGDTPGEMEPMLDIDIKSAYPESFRTTFPRQGTSEAESVDAS